MSAVRRILGGFKIKIFKMLNWVFKLFTPYGIYCLYAKKITLERLVIANQEHKNGNELNFKENFANIYEENFWGSNESRSGPGSELVATKNIRKKLPLLWKKYGIKSFLDVPCGDFNWMKTINKDGITYIGGDIVEKIVENNNELYGNESISFKVLDITEDDLPKVDMILCRDCLCHLSNENVLKALRNFKKSGAKYLLATSYPLTSQNWDINNGDFRPINLLIEPFNLPHPISKIHNGFIGIPSNYETDKTEYLFDLKDIGGIL